MCFEPTLRLVYILLVLCWYLPCILLKYATLVDLIYALGPFYIKVGQVATTRPDLFPGWFVHALTALQDQVPTGPIAHTDLVLSNEPIASGSIAQVYQVTLYRKECDTDAIAVKIKRSNINNKLNLDYRIFKWLLQNKVTEYFIDIQSGVSQRVLSLIGDTLEEHLDFIGEQENIALISDAFTDNPHIIIPKLYEELSTETQIVMEWIHGVSLNKCSSTELEVIIPILLNAVYDMVFVHRLVHGDIHEGNILVTKNKQVAFLDWGLLHILSEEDVILLQVFFQKDLDLLAQICYKWGTGKVAPIYFETALKQTFTENKDNFCNLLQALVKLFEVDQVHMKESLLKPLLAFVSVEGIAQKYSSYSIIDVVQQRALF